MFVVGLTIIVAVAASGPQVTGDFDGDGTTDTAAIVMQAGGSGGVVVTFNDGRKAPVPARVDQQAVLSVVSPAQVASVCAPFAQVLPECSPRSLRPKREGFVFKPTPQEATTLAFWTGTRFVAMATTELEQAISKSKKVNASPSQLNALPKAVQAPCKLQINRGHLIDKDTQNCRSIVDRFSPEISPADHSLHTVLQLQVNESGKIEDCQVAEASGSPELDAKACSIAIEKTRYASAPDEGRMKRQMRRLSINWSVPR